MSPNTPQTNEVFAAAAGPGSYVLLTAAYNEEEYIEATIRSVLAQDLLPSIWVIVSDGSTDRTDEIVQRYAMSYTFIRLVRRERDQHHRYASKVFALRAGLQILTPEAAQYLGHLDADIALDHSYFRDLLKKFDRDPTLGVAGGRCFEETPRGLRQLPGSSPTSVPGGIQMFRRECYQNIGELPPIEHGGEDWYAEVTARMCGWRVQSFSDLRVRHLRETGTAGNRLLYWYRGGFADFALGTHPLFEFARLARKIACRPYLLAALARLLGFLMAYFFGERMVPPEFVAFLRKEQLGRLWPNHYVRSRGERPIPQNIAPRPHGGR